MISSRFVRFLFVLKALLLLSIVNVWGVTTVTCASPHDQDSERTQYFVSLADAGRHLAHVSIRVPQSAGTLQLDMPVWNALYEVRDFATNVVDVRAQDDAGATLAVRQSSTSEWQIAVRSGCVVVHYDVYLDTSGPFGAQLSSDHGFLNWAMVLMYSPALRNHPMSLRLLDVPRGWSVRDLHVLGTARPGQLELHGVARNYDELVDSPAEAGMFQQASFQEDGATYHIVVHADPADYDMKKVEEALQKITHAAVDWMQDRPYEEYTFLYHFPRRPAGGGMEHAYGTAIDIGAERLRENPSAIANVSAHEFFHLWNVKRIRPQSLEPIDYQHEQDTRALWFCEGVTSTVADVLLVRAGLSSQKQFFDDLGRSIAELQQRPAHRWQSAEDSSLETWFESNSFYQTPERSISYYNKGEILGVLLDLKIREITQGTKSLRDLFQWMNRNYAKQHRFFDDSAGILQAAEEVAAPDTTGERAARLSLEGFFQNYVSGVQEIPYDDFFRFVGLHLVSKSAEVASAGFTTTTHIGAEAEVAFVEPDSDAQHAGIEKGDRVIAVDGKPASGSLENQIAQRHPGETVSLTVGNANGQREVKLRLVSRQQRWYELQDLPSVTPQQLAHRNAWTRGDDEGAP